MNPLSWIQGRASTLIANTLRETILVQALSIILELLLMLFAGDGRIVSQSDSVHLPEPASIPHDYIPPDSIRTESPIPGRFPEAATGREHPSEIAESESDHSGTVRDQRLNVTVRWYAPSDVFLVRPEGDVVIKAREDTARWTFEENAARVLSNCTSEHY